MQSFFINENESNSSNQCTGYENEALSIKKTGENKVTYNLKNTAEYSTDLQQDINVIMGPRVTTTINSKNNSGDDLLTTNFRYDDLGRVKLKGILFWKNKNSFMRLTAKSEYLSGTYYKNKATTIVHDSDVEKIQYEATHEYNNRGLITGNTYRTTINSETETRYQTYTYDKANRLRTESGFSELAIYSYNPDGSIKEIQRGGNKSAYTYQKGRLTKIEDKIAGTVMNFSYDNLGNCTNFAGKALEWHRGSLLKKYGSNVTYQYNNQGVRFQKKVGSVETNYYLDGAKLIAEQSGTKLIRYLYDVEGITGFTVTDYLHPYYFVKDGMGNVISIMDRSEEVARYRYDAWGNCTIVKDVGGIGTLNPIRWKSQYYDQESGFYYMNGRYYSPTTKQYLSAANIETAQANALTLYGLNLYLLCLTNPVSLGYNGYTIATNTELVYDPPSLSGWDIFVRGWNQFWQGPFGAGFAIGAFAAATILAIACPAFMPYYLAALGGVSVTLGVGAAINGFRSAIEGGSFWEGFANYINENWAQDVAIGMALAMVSFGISQAVAAIRNAGNKTEIIGKAHGSKQHQAEINRITQQMADSGNYSKIYLNRSLSSAGVEQGSLLRPDIIGVRNAGGFDLVEVASQSQAAGNALKALRRKIDFFELLPNVHNASIGNRGNHQLKLIKKRVAALQPFFVQKIGC